MARLFLKLWVLLLLTSLTSYHVQSTIFEWARKENSARGNSSERLNRTFILFDEILRQVPEAEWPQRVAVIETRLGRPVRLVKLNTLATELNADAMAVLQKRHPWAQTSANEQEWLLYRTVLDSDWVVVVSTPSQADFLIFGVLQPIVFTWIIESLLYGLALLLWLRLFWRDLRRISNAAEVIGGGQFDMTLSLRKGSALRPLADALNRMAGRIAALIRSHKDLSNAVSHELRTPLSRLRFALTMAEESDDPAERAQLHTRMQRDIDELDHLTGEMLTYSRLDRDSPPLILENEPIENWLPQLVEEESEAARARGIDIPIEVHSGVREVACESRFMARAVSNLLRNALRFARHRVKIEVNRAADQWVIHVDDDGPGIPAQAREKLFEPFARLDESRTRESGGSGLGLAIVRRIAERHQGTATIGVAPLGGARITLQWPLTA